MKKHSTVRKSKQPSAKWDCSDISCTECLYKPQCVNSLEPCWNFAERMNGLHQGDPGEPTTVRKSTQPSGERLQPPVKKVGSEEKPSRRNTNKGHCTPTDVPPRHIVPVVNDEQRTVIYKCKGLKNIERMCAWIYHRG